MNKYSPCLINILRCPVPGDGSPVARVALSSALLFSCSSIRGLLSKSQYSCVVHSGQVARNKKKYCGTLSCSVRQDAVSSMIEARTSPASIFSRTGIHDITTFESIRPRQVGVGNSARLAKSPVPNNGVHPFLPTVTWCPPTWGEAARALDPLNME